MAVKIQAFVLTLTLSVTFVSSQFRAGCAMCGVELENKVDQIEAQQAIVEERQRAITTAFSHTLTTLKKDGDTVKSTVGRLVEDNVEMGGKLRALQGLGQEVRSLSNKIGQTKQALTEKVREVQGQVSAVSNSMELDKRQEAQKLNLMNVQVGENKGMLDGVRGKLSQQTNKLAALEQKLAALAETQGSPDNIESLQKSVSDLWQTFRAAQAKNDARINGLRNEINDIMRALNN